jgi:malate synthase
MAERINCNNLNIDSALYEFINQQVLPGTSISEDNFWHDFSQLIEKFSDENQSLLDKRSCLQRQIDKFHLEHQGDKFDFDQYKQFLEDIDYLVEEPQDFTISTQNVDEEIATLAGPQLVVPIMNARFALNAANARWGSLYDALYGSDVIGEEQGAEQTSAYNPVRGQQVINFCRDFLDHTIALTTGSYYHAQQFIVEDKNITVVFANGQTSTLKDPRQFKGYRGDCILKLSSMQNLRLEPLTQPVSAILLWKRP